MYLAAGSAGGSVGTEPKSFAFPCMQRETDPRSKTRTREILGNLLHAYFSTLKSETPHTLVDFVRRATDEGRINPASTASQS